MQTDSWRNRVAGPGNSTLGRSRSGVVPKQVNGRRQVSRGGSHMRSTAVRPCLGGFIHCT